MKPMEPETQNPQRLTIIDGQKGKGTPDRGSPTRLTMWVRNLVSVVSNMGRPPLKLHKSTDAPKLGIEQIDIDELCSLSPENFLKSPQFFTLVEFYKLRNPDFSIDEERLKQGSVPTHVAHTVLKFFERSRFDLSQDPMRGQVFNEFTARILEYLCGKNRDGDKDLQPIIDDSKKDRLVGTPEVIRRFNVLGISLSHNDTGGYSDWCVYPRPTATAAVIVSSYGRKLEQVTHWQMSAIERAFRFGLLTKDGFITALLAGDPPFDDLIKNITDNLPKA